MRVRVGLTLAASACIALTAAGSARAAIGDCVTQPEDGYGATGPHAVESTSLPHPTVDVPATREAVVTVVSPVDDPGPHPVILWSHAFGATEAVQYIGLMEQLASHGYVVIHSTYQTPPLSPFDVGLRYGQLWAGFETAVDELGGVLDMDLSRVGVAGHSFGAGASLVMFKRAVLERGWGSEGSFIAVFAPFRIQDFTADDAAAVPRQTKLLVEVFDDDETNDHRGAIEDIWKPLAGSIRSVDRDYVLVHTAERGECRLPTNHSVPIEIALAGGTAVLDDYDVWAVRRRVHGIAACAFDHDQRGCEISIGEADPLQREMGNWLADGAPLNSLESLREPYPANCGEGEPCQFPHATNPYH
jgi:dienelactone hydrolase